MSQKSDAASSEKKRGSLYRTPSRGGRAAFADRLASTLREGDIVLFKGHQIHDAAIRCCTGSEYNHVAIVVNNGGELELFEASAAGVMCVPLEFYINSYYWSHMSKQFYKVVVRHLTTQSGRGVSREQRAALVRYQEEMMGRKFKLNALTYMQALLAVPHKEDMSSAFCSQLVAGAYKRMGLLPPEPAATSYFPRSFSQHARTALPLTEGVKLGKELTMIFEESPLYDEERTSLLSQASVRAMQGVGGGGSTTTTHPLYSSSAAAGATPSSSSTPSSTKGGGSGGMIAKIRQSISGPPPPTAEEVDARKRHADELLRRAHAVYTVRRCARRWMRHRKMRMSAASAKLQQEAELEVAPAAASVGEVQVEVVRSD